MEKAWAFYRRSTDKQELSVEDQRRDCKAFADRMGWSIVREFAPAKGWGSGLTIDQDPVFLEMIRLSEARKHDVHFLVVYDVSRFGRLQPEDKIYWERRLKKQGGIQIVYVKDDFKNDGSIGDVLSRVVKHSEAHQFSMKLSETTLRGCKSHAQLGHSAGGKAPYGYDRLLIDSAGAPVKVLKPGEHKADKMQRIVWTPSPNEKTVVKWIFDYYLRGNGLNRIVANMNEREVQPPRGRHWVKNMVHYMLRNRSYIGERIYNKRSYKAYRRGDKGSLFNSRDQWIVKENAHEAIVKKEVFDRVQERLKTRVITQGRTFHRPYLLTGLCVCGNCGYKMIGQPKKGNGHLYYTYTCSGYLRSGKSVCRSVNVRRDEIESVTIQSVRRHLADPGWKKELVPQLQAMIEERFGGSIETPSDDLRAHLKGIERKIQNIVRAIEGGTAAQSLSESLLRLETQREDVRQQLEEAENMAKTVNDPDALLAEMLSIGENFDDLWERCGNMEEKKEFIHQFVQSIKVTHSPTEIKADVSLFKIPWAQETLALSGSRLSLGSIAGAGFVPKINPHLTVKSHILKPPYNHRRVA